MDSLFAVRPGEVLAVLLMDRARDRSLFASCDGLCRQV